MEFLVFLGRLQLIYEFVQYFKQWKIGENRNLKTTLSNSGGRGGWESGGSASRADLTHCSHMPCPASYLL